MDTMQPDPTMGAPLMEPPQPSWWSRNWKWFVPLLALVLLLLSCCCCCLGFSYWVWPQVQKVMEVYQTALERAQNDPRVIAALGQPIEGVGAGTPGDFHSDAQRLRIQFDIGGPQGTGTVHVEARLDQDRWVIDQQWVTIDQTGERIVIEGDSETGAEATLETPATEPAPEPAPATQP